MDPRRRADDLQYERDRLLAAWLKRRGYDPYDWMRMSAAEIDEHRRRAEASSIMIPRTEDGYLYHGTSAARAARIRTEGLATDKKGIWHTSGYELHIQGRVFVCDTVQKAMFYATEMSRSRPAILRVPSVALTDLREDPYEERGSFFVERPIPASDIELWTPKGWLPGQEPAEPSQTLCSDDDPSP